MISEHRDFYVSERRNYHYEKNKRNFLRIMTETVSVTKLDGTLIVAIAALSGVIIGMLISPRKNAKYGCGNGTTYITNNGEDDWDWDDEDTE